MSKSGGNAENVRQESKKVAISTKISGQIC